MSRRIGIANGLAAATLFGLSAPASKWLLGEVSPHLLAGVLYLGAGLGLAVFVVCRQFFRKKSIFDNWPPPKSAAWFAGAILAGGIVGPVLLMEGLKITDGARAALLLNLEGVFTALIAWIVFKELFNRRVAFGMAFIFFGGVILSWPEMGVEHYSELSIIGPILVTAACLSWAIDNNLTRKISGSDPVAISLIKGLIAGVVNIVIAIVVRGEDLPGLRVILIGCTIGFLGYGLSLVCFVIALRNVGAARTGAYFSTAPFFGAIVAIALGQESISATLITVGTFMGIGVWLHLSESYSPDLETKPNL